MNADWENIAGRFALVGNDGELLNIDAGAWRDFDKLYIERNTAFMTRANVTTAVDLTEARAIKIAVRR